MFVIRAAFWLTLIVAFIPVNPDDRATDLPAVSTGETIGVLRSAVADLAGFCGRNPGSCQTGREIASQFGAKALAGATMVRDYLDGRFGENSGPEIAGARMPESQTDETRTGSVIE